MTIVHVKLYGGRTQINLPSSFRKGSLTLRGYRFLFNRDDHGYYHASVRTTLLGGTNVISFTTKGYGDRFSSELPLWIDPEKKLTQDTALTWPMGRIENPNTVVLFELALYSCIERKRYDQATFDTTIVDANITGLKGLSTQQAYFGEFGNSVPLYVVPRSMLPNGDDVEKIETGTIEWEGDGTAANTWADGLYNTTINSLEDEFYSRYRFDADGTQIGDSGSDSVKPYPAPIYVHTGVQVGSVDPRAGGKDYSTHRMTPQEEKEYANSTQRITGSGYRTNAVIYPYTMELVFEITE